MKIKKMLALLLVMSMVMSIAPVATFAENQADISAGTSQSAPSDAPASSGGTTDPAEKEPTPTPTTPAEKEPTPTPTTPAEKEPTPTTTPVENVPTPEVPQPQVPVEVPTVDELRQRLEAAESFHDFWAVLHALTEAEWALLQQNLSEEKYQECQAIAAAAEPEIPEPICVTEGGDETPVAYTDVAPLLPPVTGPEVVLKTRMSEELCFSSDSSDEMDASSDQADEFDALSYASDEQEIPSFLMESNALMAPMAMSFLAAPAPPTLPTRTADEEGTKGLELSKQAVPDGDQYKITLDAYVTGEYKSETTVTKIPSDIVLVLDESGSMGDTFSANTIYEYNQYDRRYGRAQDAVLYSRDATGTFKEVSVKETDKQWVSTGWFSGYHTYLYTFTRYGEETPFFSERRSEDAFINNGIKDNAIEIYTRKTSVSRKAALQEAATNFVASVRADNAKLKDPDKGHKIAVVGFASDSRVIQDLTDCNDKDILSAIDSLKADGATNSKAGMEHAKTIIQNNPPTGEPRNQVVILFTDGEPTTSDVFSKTVANGAISEAKKLKDGKATVYTIGIFSGANASDTKSNTNRYMNFVSSNFKNAQSMDNGGEKTRDGYYLVASSSGELNNIFAGLSQVIENGDPAMKGLDESTVLRDVISPYFKLADAKEDIKVYTANCTGKDASGTFTFGTPQPINSAQVNISNDRSIEVSGFDYSGNFVGQKTDGSFVGQKLVVEVPVKPIDGFFGGNGVPTNTDASGLYKNGTPLDKFELPAVNVPLNYSFATRAQSIYLSNSANVKDMIDWEALPKPDGIKNAYVNLNFTVKQGDTELKKTIPAKAENFESLSQLLTPTDCTTYTISCEVEPTSTPVGGYPVTQLESKSAMVHVLKPTINTQDAWSDYNDTVDLTKCVVLGNQNADVTWTDFKKCLNSPTVTGEKPSLDAKTFTYQYMEGNQKVAGTTFNPTTEANFQLATIQLGDKSYPNTDFAFGSNSNSQEPNKLKDCHFTLHMNRFDFVLNKNVVGNKETYPQASIFEVQYGDATYPMTFDSTGGTKTIKGLLYGKNTTISVTEDTNWSWRYTSSTKGNSVEVTKNAVAYGIAPTLTAPAAITFTNTLAKQKWLSGTDYRQNQYSAIK